MSRYAIAIVLLTITIMAGPRIMELAGAAAANPTALSQAGETAEMNVGGPLTNASDPATATSSLGVAIVPQGSPPRAGIPAVATPRLNRPFALDVRLLNPTAQPIDVVEVSLEYDASILEVVNDSGTPAATLLPNASLPVVLLNRVDAAKGWLSLALGRSLEQKAPAGDLLLGTAQFRAKSTSPGTPIRFIHATVAGRMRPTVAAFRGVEIPLASTGTMVRVAP